MAMSKGLVVALTVFLLLIVSSVSNDSLAACSSPAKIAGYPYVPTSIQDAYNYASNTLYLSSFTLLLAGENVTEDLVLDGGAAQFEGGYDCGFTTRNGTTGIAGTITIKAGAAIFSQVKLIVDASVCAFDNDGDGHTSIGSCTGTADDCNDNNASIYPGAPDLCDGLDNDCNGQVDEVLLPVDADGDGYYGPGSCAAVADDCNDNDATIHPNALDTAYDGIDQDCSGADLTYAEDNYCVWCHLDPTSWEGLHFYTEAPDNSCAPCHAATVSNILPGHYGDTVRTAGNNMNAGAKINCASCHDQVSNFHNFGANIVWGKVTADMPDITCDTCHENRAAGHVTGTAHDFRVVDSACATCHTSDTTTLGSPGSGSLNSASDIDTLHRSDCTVCHNYTGMVLDAGIVRLAITQGLHGTPVSCKDCHTTNGVNHGAHDHPVAVGPDDLSYAAPGVLCSACHAAANWDEINLTHNVPINGAGSCATCHRSPRQNVIDAIALGANPTRCVTCHPDKYLTIHGNVDHVARGYVLASTPCLACHDPGTADNATVTVTHLNDCSLCHLIIPNLVPGIPAGARDCSSCHPTRHTGLSCNTCHGHSGDATALEGNHPKHVGSLYNFSCAKCHADTVSDSNTISNQALHINAQPDVSLETGTYTAGTQACASLYCHSNARGGAPNRSVAWSDSTATSCTDCHGDLSDPDPALAGDSFKVTSGAHDVLASPKWIRKYPCDYCHYTTASSSGVIKAGGYHVNEQLDVVINARWKIAGRSYPSYNSGSKNCDNLYCHSDGRSVNPVTINLSWVTDVAYCDSCHGHRGDCASCHDGSDGGEVITAWPLGKEWMQATPMYSNTGAGTSNANSHVRHLQTNFSCENCHFTTIKTDDGTCVECHIEGQETTGSMDEVGHVDPAFHVNKAKDVVFKDGGVYDPVTKSCANTSCHSGAYQDPVWGGTVKCLTCHGTTGADVDDFDAFNGTQARINMTEWQTSGHGRPAAAGPYPSGNPAANFPVDNPCWHCHDRTVVHEDASNPYRLQIHPQFEKRFEKECVYCHMEGTDSECLGCHDAAGSLAPQIETILVPTNHTGMTSCTTSCHVDDSSRHKTDAGVWTKQQKDDVKNQYVMMGVCLQCHDNDDNNRCNSCHTWSGDSADNPYKIGFDPGPGFIAGSSKASSGHFGHEHWQTYLSTGKWKGGKFCWDCHDPHGDKNIYMIQDQVATETEGKFGKPVSRAAVSFTKTTSGLDYAKTNAPYNGICNVCHQNTDHYKDDYGDGHRASRRCTECHEHGFGGSHASGGACNSCHQNKPIPNHLGFGLPRDCTACHNGAILKRTDVLRQFEGQSHHVQGVELTNKHCYQCHWESTPEGLIDNTYHAGYNYKTYETVANAPSDLVIYGAETRPTSYQLGVTAVTFDATRVGTGDERAEVAKISTHCLGCHSDQNNDYTPFGDCKTPRQYAWDRQSIDARYSQGGTTTWGKYSGTHAADKSLQKAFSAHGNAVANQGGWDAASGEDGALPNTRDGSQNVQCFDCHSSHGSYTSGVTSSYKTFDDSYGGGNLKETQAGKGGYGVTYRAAGVTAGSNPMSAAAAQCFDCHETAAAGSKPWGYNSTFGATAPIMGYRDSARFGDGERGTQVRFPFKASRSNMGGHLKASSALTNNAMHAINGSCTPCHDPHGVSPVLGENQAYAVPLLKGTWLTSPFKEDSPQVSLTTRNSSSTVYPGRKLFGTVGGTSQGVANKLTQADTQFAGLCLRCHPKQNLTDGTNKNSAFRSLDRVHETVNGWGNNAEHSFSCSKCHQPHVSGLPRLMRTNCLDTNHRGNVASGGPNPGRRNDTQSYPRLNNVWPACHETQTGSWNNQQWNEVTTW